MEIYCTRPACPRPQNFFADLDDRATLQTAQQKFCTTCGMPLILVGRYLPSKLLGKGGFGTAFLARDRYTPAMRQCVVKQFQPSGDLSPPQLRIAQELFEREAAVLEQLGSTHPQIPDLFAFFPLSVPGLQPGKEDQFFYLVQEFIDGQDLEKELQTKGPYSEAEALEVLKQILKVLKFVHKNGSIHRDIKPSNIMRDRNGRLFLLDFGAVKQVTTVPVQTGRSTGIYSMGFAPPEQMSGGQVYPSTDLYALAVTVITLLTGKEAVELFDSYNNQWNWQNYVQVSDTLANVLDKMLLAAPNQRFQSAQEVIEALTPRQVTPSPPPPPPVPQPPITPPIQQTPVNPPPIPSNPQPIARSPAFSLLEVLGGAAFTGFEGGLILIAFTSLLKSPQISIGLLGMIVGLLIYLQYRRIIEGKDRPIIAVITLLAVMLIGPLHGSILPLIKAYSPIIVIFAATIGGALAIAAYALFRLIYLVLSRLLS
ncbi:MAG: serine/threonine-protein kinase [Potamolinea sp.]